MARVYGNLSNVCLEMGDVGHALTYHRKSLAIKERGGDWHGAAYSYFNLGNLYLKQGDREQARIHYERARALFEMVGYDGWQAQDAARKLRRL